MIEGPVAPVRFAAVEREIARERVIPLGIQLYTVRAECKDNFKGTLSALAAMGYHAVEFAWYYGGMTPDGLAAFLEEVNLTCCGLHAPLAPLLDPGSEWYAYAQAVHSPFVSTSCADAADGDWMGTIQKIRQAGAVARSLGLTFTYHNHAQEFRRIAGRCALDMLYDETDPETVRAELDTYWIQKGGADPAAYIRKYAGRTPQVHLKDMDGADGGFTEPGEGTVDFPAVFEAARNAGVEWVIYEQDHCKRPPLESARITLANLRRAGLI